MALGPGNVPGNLSGLGVRHLGHFEPLPEMLLVLVHPVLEVLRSVPDLPEVTVHAIHE